MGYHSSAPVAIALILVGIGLIVLAYPPNFYRHSVEFASLFGMIGLLFAVGGLLFLSSSKRLEIRTRVLEEKYTKKEVAKDKPSTSAASQ